MSYRLYTIYCEMEKVRENRGDEPLLPHNGVPRFSVSLYKKVSILLYKSLC